ncbi:MAG TPA: pyridoxal-dependent decarboxylase, partial [Longimicrobiaceae bacterium]|nr:pyridoxal-dependent decarboxylase [Longimicrobiaceae bacterium]
MEHVESSAEASAAANAAELRRAGHALVDRMAEYMETVEARGVSTPHSPGEIEPRFREPLPLAGAPAEEVWDEVWTKVVGDAIHLAHPMYMGHQVAPPLPHAVLADALASLLNNSVAVWEMSPTGTFVEGQVVRWMTELLGYPATSDGTLVSGGSVANLTGLLAAREAHFPGSWRNGVAADGQARRATIFVSDHSHYSAERAAGLMGMGSDAVVGVRTRAGKMEPAALEEAIAAAREA